MLDALKDLYTGVVYDTLRDMGITNCVLDNDIRPVYPINKLYGKIWTCEGQYSENINMDESLSSWSKMLSNAPNGHIVICSANNAKDHNINFTKVSHMGELSAEVLKMKDIKGFITDGGTRDAEFLEKINLPVFCTYVTPKDIVGHWKIISEGNPISIKSSSIYTGKNIKPVTIKTGDILLYDSDGTVIIPSECYKEVIKMASEKTNKENNMRQSILDGMDPYKAYKKFGIF